MKVAGIYFVTIASNNNNTHRPYFHSQALNLVGCVGGVSVC